MSPHHPRRAPLWLALAAVTLGVAAATLASGTGPADVAATGRAAGIPEPAPSGCVVDPADILGWWAGEDDLTAEIGPDLAGSVGFADAVVDRGMAFVAGLSVVGVDGFPAVTDGVSVDAWIRPVFSNQAQSLISRWTHVGGEGDDVFALRLIGNELDWLTDEDTRRAPEELRVAAPQLFDGGFHHVAATWSTTQMVVYVDGAAVATKATRGGVLNAAASTPLRLGSASGLGTPMDLDGVLDEPSVYRRALTPTEIAAIHGAGAAGKCNPSPPDAEQAKLTAADGPPGDWFGRSVAIEGNTAVVGASQDPSGGSAYVYTRSGTTWSPQAELVPTGGAASDDFGHSVAISGNTIVVGAFEHDTNGILNSGAAYVFTRTGTTWTQQAELSSDQPTQVDNFGRSVDISGETIVVGVLFDDDLGSNSGSAYVFTRAGSTWTQQAKLLAGDGATGDGFGFSVAVDGDTVAVGSDLDDDAGSASGSAYVFVRSGSAWSQQAKVTAADAAAGDSFGTAVDVIDDTLLVGAPFEDDVAGDTGAAYAFLRTGTAWAQEAKLTAAVPAAGDAFGYSIAINPDDTAIVGAPGDDDGGIEAGSVHVFSREAGVWTLSSELAASDGAAGDEFGTAVAIDGGTAVVGAYAASSETGAAYVYASTG